MMGSRDFVDDIRTSERVTDGLGSLAKNNILLSTSSASKQPIQPLFESRGAAMIKAALSDRNKQETNKSLNGKAGTYTRYKDRNDEKLLQRLSADIKVRRRSFKNNVIFTEPVVTKQYEYEQTPLETLSDGTHSPPEHKQIFGAHPKNSRFLFLPKLNDSPCDQFGSPKMKPRLYMFGSQNDGDSEDDLVTLESSEEDMRKVERVTKVKLSSVKRSYETIEDGSVVESKSEHRVRSTASVSKSKSVSGGLFSAPKVAKIMPYYEDHPMVQEEEQTDSNSMKCNYSNRTSQYKRRRSRALSQKMHIPGRHGSMSVSQSESIASSQDNIEQVIINNDNGREDVSELLSFKKIQIQGTGGGDTRGDSEAFQNKDPEPSSGYFSWLTTFLSNQMSKLIF